MGILENMSDMLRAKRKLSGQLEERKKPRSLAALGLLLVETTELEEVEDGIIGCYSGLPNAPKSNSENCKSVVPQSMQRLWRRKD